MAALNLANYKFTVNGKDHVARLGPNYDTIATALGLTKLGPNDASDGKPKGRTALVRDGLAVPLTITYLWDSTKLIYRSARIICPIDKLSSALSGLEGNMWKTYPIKSVTITTRASYG